MALLDLSVELLGEVTLTTDRCSKNLVCIRNISHKCNKQVTSKQRNKILSHFFQQTTIVLETAMTILEIGISLPTLVERKGKALHSSIAREFCSEGRRYATKQEKSFYHRRLIVSLNSKTT
jgi:hypothetical protein